MGCFACSKQTDLKFTRNGTYKVSVIDTPIEFTVVLNGDYEEYTFTSPPTVSGLKAITYDGVNYSLSFNGIESNAYSSAIKVATDFSAATSLLEKVGTFDGDTFTATIDSQTAKATTNKKTMDSVYYSNGTNTRNYKIITEATG